MLKMPRTRKQTSLLPEKRLKLTLQHDFEETKKIFADHVKNMIGLVPDVQPADEELEVAANYALHFFKARNSTPFIQDLQFVFFTRKAINFMYHTLLNFKKCCEVTHHIYDVEYLLTELLEEANFNRKWPTSNLLYAQKMAIRHYLNSGFGFAFTEDIDDCKVAECLFVQLCKQWSPCSNKVVNHQHLKYLPDIMRDLGIPQKIIDANLESIRNSILKNHIY